MARIVLASSNRGKLAEFGHLLADADFEVVTQGELGVTDIEETGLTFVENALLKARHAAQVTGLPALADDSGLCVDALQGAPGLYSARYAGGHGDSAANNAKLLRTLDGRPDAERRAFFICVLVLLRHAEDPAPLVAEGRWHGRVLHAPRGEGGFGYDPLFLPDGHERSAAELDKALKNRISHRGQALDRLRARLGDLAA
jgi:XTP/dITP diphosphohydrolase